MRKPIAAALAATAIALSAALQVAAAPQHEGTLSYERTGHGATTLLLIPGLGSGAEVWKDVVADLSDRYTIVTVTLDGFDGTAAPSGRASLDADVASLDALIAKAKLGKPVVVGHSLGGFLALRLAAEHPGDVSKVVAVDALPIFPPPQPGETAAGRAAAAHALAAGIKGAESASFAAQSRATAAQLVTSPENVEWVTAMTVRSDRDALGDGLEQAMLADLRPALPKIAAPVLVMGAGAAYGVDATKAFYAALYGGTPAVSFEIFGAARHFIMLDQKAPFERVLVAFAPPA